MEQERIAREEEEKEKAEKVKKIKEQFGDPNSQWEKDKTEMQNIALKDKATGDKASTDKEKDAAGAKVGHDDDTAANKPAVKKSESDSAKAPVKEVSK